MAEQNPDGSKVARLLVSRLGSSQGVSATGVGIEPD